MVSIFIQDFNFAPGAFLKLVSKKNSIELAASIPGTKTVSKYFHELRHR
jgi:hypothetical protein